MKRSLLATMALASTMSLDLPAHAGDRPYSQPSVSPKTAKTHKERARSKAAAKSRRAQRKARK